MSYYAFSALFNFLLSVFLGWFVFQKNQKSQIHQNLFLLCLSAGWWAFFYFLWQMTQTETLALWWTRFLMFGAIWVAYFYVKVVALFLERERELRNALRLAFWLGVVFSVLVATPYMVAYVEPLAGFLFWPKPGPAYHAFLFWFSTFMVYGCYLSYHGLRHATPLMRRRLQIMFAGMALSIVAGSTNYFLWYDIPIKPYGNILASVYVACVSYAIVRHHVLDIRVVLRNSYVYLSSLASMLVVAVVVDRLTEQWFSGVPEVIREIVSFSIAIALFPTIRDWSSQIATKYFFSSLYDMNKVMSALGQSLRSILNTKKLFEVLDSTFESVFHPKGLCVLAYDNKTKIFVVLFNRALNLKGVREYQIFKRVEQDILRWNTVFSVEVMREDEEYVDLYQRELDVLNAMGVDIVVPLVMKDRLIGLMLLGGKENGDAYSAQDVEVLDIIRTQAAIAFENALLYQESLAFGKKLKVEVENATRELRAANDKLTQLDQAKTEFLSITSHQLRTPLTGIKGYLSMMLEGDFGTFSEQQEETVRRVSEEVDRLARMVQVFLNVSRIESGRLIIAKLDFNFADLINTVVRELKPIAEKKKLELLYTGPAHLPYTGDSDKLKDVVMNLIDNAIKYTPSGRVLVEASQSKNGDIRIDVKDTGVGIDPDEIGKLFEKFSRAKGIAEVSAEGSGLGLFIVKKIVEAHGGTVSASSEGCAKGSTFTCVLPKIDKQQPAASSVRDAVKPPQLKKEKSVSATAVKK